MKIFKLVIVVLAMILFLNPSLLKADLWQGSWQTTYGELRLHQQGNKVYGDYADRGIIEANYNPTKKELTGTYTNQLKQGTFSFQLKGNKFTGTWKWSTGSGGKWNGSKKNSSKPQLTKYYAMWQGSWETTYGELRLHQKGNKVHGDYADRGNIDATYSPVNNTLTGIFTNKNRKGTFSFQLKGNKFIGTWKWSTGGGGKWTGSKKNNSKPILITYNSSSATQNTVLRNIPTESFECGYKPDAAYIALLKNPNSIKNKRLAFLQQYSLKQISNMERLELKRGRFSLPNPVGIQRDNQLLFNNTRTVPIVAHIIRRSDWSGGISQSTIEKAINTANRLYEDFNIKFELCEARYINSNAIFKTNFSPYSDEEDTDNASYNVLDVSNRNVARKLNIYFVPSSSTSWAWRPNDDESKQHIVMNNSQATNGSTLSHEIGHWFDLLHTHGRSNNSSTTGVETDELVNGSNCSSAGDCICDTPADPNLSGKVNASCTFTATTLRDANGHQFTPDTRNIMAYTHSSCRKHFSKGQAYRMQAAYLGMEEERGYTLETTSCAPITTPLSLSGYYKCNDGGHYYIRQVGKDIYWFGEHPNGHWANVFKGRLTGNAINGYFWDVPKGKASGRDYLKLSVSADRENITKLSGAFGGTRWTRTNLPARLPSKRTAGFQQIGNINDMDGAWTCNDGGTYYIQEIGGKIAWFGEGGLNSSGKPHFANVGIGTRSGNTINIDWVDVPKCSLKGSGHLVLRINNANEIVKTSSSSFGGSTWTRGNTASPVYVQGYYKCNDGGHYYIQQVGKDIYWFGEHPNGHWGNVFKGRLTGNAINGYFWDVPKGKASGRDHLKLSVSADRKTITKLSGAFGGTRWTKTNLPPKLPGKRTAGFRKTGNINNMDGAWTCNDGGTYYIREIGGKIAWFGEGGLNRSGKPNFANVGIGTRSGNTITINWTDVPKCGLRGSGNLVLRINNANEIVKTNGRSFGGSKWRR